MFGSKVQENSSIRQDSTASENDINSSAHSIETLEEVRETNRTSESGLFTASIEELKKQFIEKIDQYSVRGFTGKNSIDAEVATYLDTNAIEKLH